LPIDSNTDITVCRTETQQTSGHFEPLSHPPKSDISVKGLCNLDWWTNRLHKRTSQHQFLKIWHWRWQKYKLL